MTVLEKFKTWRDYHAKKHGVNSGLMIVNEIWANGEQCVIRLNELSELIAMVEQPEFGRFRWLCESGHHVVAADHKPLRVCPAVFGEFRCGANISRYNWPDWETVEEMHADYAELAEACKSYVLNTWDHPDLFADADELKFFKWAARNDETCREHLVAVTSESWVEDLCTDGSYL